MLISENVALKLRDAFNQVITEGSLQECLDELSRMAAHVLGAQGCTILLLSEEEVERSGLHDATEFGSLPGRLDKSRKLATPPSASVVRGGKGDMASMVSTIILRGRIIGVIHACRPQQQSGFTRDDLELLSILTPLITKTIQVIQLQNILKSRFTQIALTKSSESTIRDLISGVRQNPNQIARILAKSFYREMLSAGFNFNQIIFAATEVISELSQSVRKHSANCKPSVDTGSAGVELLFHAPGDPSPDSPRQSADTGATSMAA